MSYVTMSVHPAMPVYTVDGQCVGHMLLTLGFCTDDPSRSLSLHDGNSWIFMFSC